MRQRRSVHGVGAPLDGQQCHCGRRSPIRKDSVHARRVREAEREVQVRPAVTAALRQSPDLGAGDYAWVRVRHLQHAIPHASSFLDGEHRAIVRDLCQ